jgi:hypothetical protein
VICFEWLQRPENVLAGYVSWNDYHGKSGPTQIRIEHHKTGEMVLHPLEETVSKVRTLFYGIMAQTPPGAKSDRPGGFGRVIALHIHRLRNFPPNDRYWGMSDFGEKRWDRRRRGRPMAEAANRIWLCAPGSRGTRRSILPTL